MPEAMTTCEWCGEDCDKIWEFLCRGCGKIFHECSDCDMDSFLYCKDCWKEMEEKINE